MIKKESTLSFIAICIAVMFVVLLIITGGILYYLPKPAMDSTPQSTLVQTNTTTSVELHNDTSHSSSGKDSYILPTGQKVSFTSKASENGPPLFELFLETTDGSQYAIPGTLDRLIHEYSDKVIYSTPFPNIFLLKAHWGDGPGVAEIWFAIDTERKEGVKIVSSASYPDESSIRIHTPEQELYIDIKSTACTDYKDFDYETICYTGTEKTYQAIQVNNTALYELNNIVGICGEPGVFDGSCVVDNPAGIRFIGINELFDQVFFTLDYKEQKQVFVFDSVKNTITPTVEQPSINIQNLQPVFPSDLQQ